MFSIGQVGLRAHREALATSLYYASHISLLGLLSTAVGYWSTGEMIQETLLLATADR